MRTSLQSGIKCHAPKVTYLFCYMYTQGKHTLVPQQGSPTNTVVSHTVTKDEPIRKNTSKVIPYRSHQERKAWLDPKNLLSNPKCDETVAAMCDVTGRMEPITDHMRHVSLNHRGAEAAIANVTAEARAAAAAAAAAAGTASLPADAVSLKPALATEQVAGETVSARGTCCGWCSFFGVRLCVSGRGVVSIVKGGGGDGVGGYCFI